MRPNYRAPCFDCGHDPQELADLSGGKHTYSEVMVFGVPIILCNFCQAEFSSYDPEYFNRPGGTKLGIGQFTVVRDLTTRMLRHEEVLPLVKMASGKGRMRYLSRKVVLDGFGSREGAWQILGEAPA